MEKAFLVQTRHEAASPEDPVLLLLMQSKRFQELASAYSCARARGVSEQWSLSHALLTCLAYYVLITSLA